MTVRSIQQGSQLSATGDATLATLLRRCQGAAAERAAVPADAAFWQAAETRSAMAIARANAILGVSLDPRTVLGVLVASVARTDLGGTPSRSRLVSTDAHLAHDSAAVASWLLSVDRADAGRGHADLYEAGATAAAEVLGAAVDDELLAAAWTAVCGLALLEVVAESSTHPQGPPAEAEVRLVQRVTCHCLATNRGMPAARLSRLVGADRRTMSTWLRYGSPSPHNSGHLVPARHCAALVGINAADWRTLQEGPAPRTAHEPHRHAELPRPVAARGCASWDEGEVMAWFEGHDAPACSGLCRRHSRGSVTEFVVIGGALAQRVVEQPARRWLQVVR